MFRSSELAGWLATAGVTASMEFDGQSLADIQQDVVVVLSLTGGASSILERTFDNPTVQVISRGQQMDPDSAEDLAYQIDQALLLPASTVIGTTKVIGIDRIGGPPRLLQRDRAHRNIFTCNYIFTVARSTF
jgi:uncharacterized protein YceK